TRRNFRLNSRADQHLTFTWCAHIQVEKHNETVKQNRAFLNRLIDVTSLLDRQELSFRGHDESSTSSNKGNYRKFTETLSKYDSVLATQFQSSAVFSGMSHSIQNDLISALAATVSDEIRDEIQAAPFFGWQVDETTDIACCTQLSVIVRYVDSAGKIQERFIGFFDVSEGRDTQSVFEVLNENMQGYNFKDKLVAQTYDGAAVMASALNGRKVKAIAPSAMFVHCYAHRLNLVLSQGAKCLSESRIFFASLSGFATFFSKSTKRTSFLESADKTMDDDTLDCAKGFVMKLDDFEFVFMLYTYEQIFSETDVVFDIVQQRPMDVLFCKKRRSEGAFQAIYDKAASLTSDPCDEPMRKRRLSQLQDPKERYRNLYMAILKCLMEQIPLRFSNLESLRFLELVNPGKFADMRDVFPEEAFQSLLKNMELDSAMPQLYKLLSLVATIGATSAGVERSFSCLKRLKSYTSNTMGQGRLSSLALLAIERTLVKFLEKTPTWYDKVTDHFLKKERRAEFTFK
uniref:DUF4371 domain-containing protein n=1 Tax=Sphaeramia orbicularis TaxID=375764 RepID=A0A673BCZ9_9TELE